MRPFSHSNSWNRYETALLIDLYNRIKDGEIKKRSAVPALSARLRNRMILNGIEINEKYRNESGIVLQMSSIDYCFTNGEHGLKPSNTLFPEMCDLYLSDRSQFNLILYQAERMYPMPVGAVQETETPPSQANPPKQDNYNTSIPQTPVLEEPTAPYQNNLLLDQIKATISQYFVNGFRLNSTIEFKRFTRFYQEKFNKTCTLTIEQFSQMVKSCGIICNGKVFIPEQLLPIGLRDEIKSHVESELSQGKPCVYYEVLFNDFKEKLLDTLISDKDTLQTCLQFFFDDKWHFSDEAISLTDSVKVDIDKEVVNFIKEQGRVVTEDEAVAGLSHLPSEDVRRAFGTNKDELIISGKKQRFHIRLFVINNQELKVVKSLINKAIKDFRFITSEELFKDIKQSIPSLLANNTSIPDIGIRNALASKLGHLYAFNGPIISAIDDDITASDALLDFAFRKRNFTLDEVDAIASSLNVSVASYLNLILDYSIRINDKTFVHVEKVNFNIDATDAAISKYIDKKGYLPIKDLTSFAAFPECGFPWNPRLLESFLLTRSRRYTLLYNTFLTKNSVGGAIVQKNSSNLQSLKDVIALALADSGIPLKEADAINYLVKKGYINRKRYAHLEHVLMRAKALRGIN